MRPYAVLDHMPAFSPRSKKLIGTVVLLVWLPLYALAAMRAGIAILPDAGPLLTLLYYAVTGTAWIIPIGLMLPWMHREPKRIKGGRPE